MVLRQIVCSGFSLRPLYLRPLREVFPAFSSLAFITASISVHRCSSVVILTSRQSLPHHPVRLRNRPIPNPTIPEPTLTSTPRQLA